MVKCKKKKKQSQDISGPHLNLNTFKMDLASGQVGLLLARLISLRIPFPLTMGQSRLGAVIEFGSRYKRIEELGVPRAPATGMGAHACRTEWE